MSTTLDLMRAIKSNTSTQGVTLDHVRAGSRVVIRSGFGSEAPETVTLDNVEADIKNGRPGCDYTDRNGNGRWAYLSQIQQVVAY